MKSEDPYKMRPLWDALLEIYQEFAKICDRHGLRYSIAEGNAIGVFRHKGFVPWDDDIDVAMPRPDYEKFKEVAKQELPPNLVVWDSRDEPSWRYTFGKVQEIRKDKVLEVEKAVGRQQSNGLYIDIFVFDGLPSGWLARKIYKWKVLSLGCILRFRNSRLVGQTRAGKIAWLYGCMLSFFWPNTRSAEKAMATLRRQVVSVPFEGASTIWRAGSTNRVTMEFPSSIWNGVSKFEFDEAVVPVFNGYDCYLRIQYGDYMKLPPKDKQVPSHSLETRNPWWLGPTK